VPSSELLKQYLETSKKDTILLGKVSRYLLSQINDRDTTVLHPSEIVRSDWCLRASWFLLNGREKPLEPISLRLASIFAEGHAIHDKWQGWLTGMDVLIGVWYCRQHDDLWWGKRSEAHEHCWSVKYQEVPVFGKEYIEGSGDGWLDLPQGHFFLEIKSIGTGTVRANGGRIDPGGLEKTFSGINAPYTPHVRQVMFYLWLLWLMYREGELPQKPPTKALILYECKSDQAVKEFVVDYDEDWLEPVFDKLEQFDPDTRIPPPCSSGKPECKQCKGYV
jgi:hypothetical protein